MRSSFIPARTTPPMSWRGRSPRTTAPTWWRSISRRPPHSAFDWHDAPEPQYVVTLAGTLEFTTRDGEIFVLRPGDVLVATDDVGSGHKWRLIDDQPWRRAYVVLKPGARDLFVPKRQ